MTDFLSTNEVIVTTEPSTEVVIQGIQGPEGAQGPPGPEYAPPVDLGFISGSVISNVTNAVHFRGTVVGNFTLENPVNPSDGQKVVWEFTMGGIGGYSISFGSKFTFGIDISNVSLTAAPGRKDFVGAVYHQVEDKWFVIALVKGY